MTVSFSKTVCDYLDSEPPKEVIDLINKYTNSMPTKWEIAQPYILEANELLKVHLLSFYAMPTPLNTPEHIQLKFIH